MNHDPKAKASGNIATSRMDLRLIANMVATQSRVLDIGCGNGDLLHLLSTQYQVDARGLELSQKGVNACVSRGLAVVQGNADKDLSYYPDKGFDTVILSQTLQATQHPREVLQEMARIGGRLIVSIPNFGHWRVRLQLLTHGRMPITSTLETQWYETANIHLCTLADFTDLCQDLSLEVEQSITLNGKGGVNHYASAPPAHQNLWAELAVFVLG
ncbi:MAG: methionine biosynthesis protein MetW [Alphaproteobacteria bacterium]|nr:methionine biosynthesis protein MetW [Alphaproteobacteria bacterium]